MVAILADVFAAKSLLKLPTKNCLIREEELSNFDKVGDEILSLPSPN
ncbi:MAG: hypothetical protein F6K22_25730 [Okeania sp. SIO2F4]|nr:hypothetical protein [Okeania sp. SIO2F4]NES05906.1 hypothetical protein [Okeania sp. SIO2F4]